MCDGWRGGGWYLIGHSCRDDVFWSTGAGVD